MMRERNGVLFFPIDEDFKDHPAFKALQSVSLGDVRLPDGFFLREENGKKYVIPATKEERRAMLRKAFPNMTPEAFDAFCLPSVFDFRRCEDNGECHQLKPRHRCERGFDPENHQYFCACNEIA